MNFTDPAHKAEALEKDINDVALLLRYLDRKGNETSRIVVPLLVIPAPSYKLIAWCTKRDAVRTFFLSSILNWDPVAPEDAPKPPPRNVLIRGVVKTVLRSRRLKYAFH